MMKGIALNTGILKFALGVLVWTLAGLSPLLAQNAKAFDTVAFESNFDLDAYQLDAKEKGAIDSLLQVYPLSIVESVQIFGHTDSLADNEYNLALSKKRVQSILAYLVYLGLDPIKVKTDYYGEERPRYALNSDAWEKNRRVELYLTINRNLLPETPIPFSEREFQAGEKLRIPKLNFVGNQPIPIWQSFPALKEILKAMRRNPDLEIELQGHVCCSNDEQLSVERARMVYYFLLANGIGKERLSYRGFSNKQPLFKEVDARSRELNRRVEVLVRSNSDRRVAEIDEKMKVELKAPVLNVKFSEGAARLIPSGDFMITLVAEMLKESEGLSYQFTVYDNIKNARLTKQRAATLNKTLRKKGVPYRSYKVSDEPAPDWMSISPNLNSVVLSISEKK